MIKDTIVANATPLIPSGVSIIRISGEKALEIGKKIFATPSQIQERKVYFGKVLNRKGEIIDEGLFIFFKAPRSFTGEDVVEIHTHGSVPVVRRVIEEAIYFGARLAQPGEFTKRAFLNGKIDLTQAEAIAELISAKTEKASKIALNILEGKLSQKINYLREKLIELISLIEAEINFPEDVEEIDIKIIQSNLLEVINQINKLIESYNKGRIIKEGIKLAIVGRPNVGKSSLFNALIGYERAIVSQYEGTTRDFIEERAVIQGIPIILLDTAGIRESSDYVEKIGIQKAKEKIEEADIILFVFDLSKGFTEEDKKLYEEIKDKSPIIVGNKLDIAKNLDEFKNDSIILVSSKTSEGLKKLEEAILNKLSISEEKEEEIFINVRHLNALTQAKSVLENVLKNLEILQNQKEILMLDLQESLRYLEEIVGVITTEEILGNIFYSFCIGK
ncbi:tRNA uridine-5-carboxymethylaminomethyl(34) synthesis GTPase MnmE [Venenivibrio stagnispumantis]|uniref:tRNA modification GTPase MnmE n=1 Tax=Venenivibrio stagnispumantis TaxID=407998 RepID=A0AA46AD52_9AQUI|nr:tRNA uridine-5-carboxymethylaminomethyl(34) synthesis GTPase MnmE [Venenivibrio stagnispumantis]MCW4572463.1 tRNA uridine-5-carboxymethylaminomethyl(34) synthesis GTPase MnmE [Venenivibrio stagnispumantis]SMP02566.1 tRNA modification GTPase trmE [Venenivibrio stagnispumantis]